MSITHNGKEYGATKVINYSAVPDYNRGIAVDNIQSGNYQATDNGFLMIQLQSQQSNPTKVSVVRSKTPITNTGTEIASIVLSQYQYSETLTAQVMARDYYKLVIEGVGNPQVISCMFYPYASTVPMKLTENINVEQVEGLENELYGKQDKGNYFNKDTDKINLANQVTGALGTNNIADSAITSAKIAANAVTGNKIANKTITASNIADNSVYNNAIVNGAVTDAKFSGALSIAKGGTGTTDGFGWKNLISWNEFLSKIGLSSINQPFTIQQIIDAIQNKNMGDFQTSFYFWGANLICPGISYGESSSNIMTIKKIRSVYEFIFFFGPFGNIYRMHTNNATANNFYEIITTNGTIPADLISPTVLKYENSDGTWTETKLNTGEVMLEGYGKTASLNSVTSAIIITPKTINTSKNVSVIANYVGGAGNTNISETSVLCNFVLNNTIAIANNNTGISEIFWKFNGILA